MTSATITVAFGDEHPAAMEAALHVLREAGAQLEIETIEIGKRIYAMGSTTGILPSSYDSLNRTRILLKGQTAAPENQDIKQIIKILCENFEIAEDSCAIENHSTDISAAAYIGESFAMFESMPGMIEPASSLLAASLLLKHIGQADVAARIESAMQLALQEGWDRPSFYQKLTGTAQPELDFAEAVVKRLAVASAESMHYKAASNGAST